MILYVFLGIGLIFICLILWMTRKFQSITIDINKDCCVSFLKVKNVEEIINQLPYHGNVLDLDNIIPKEISIDYYKDKGWGIKTNKDLKKHDLIYKYPITKFPENYKIKVKCHLGEKFIERDVHLDYFSDKYNVFPSWDAFINHEDIPNCYYDKKYEIKNKKVYGILRASKDIKKGEELNIDYKNEYYIYSSFWDLL